MDKWGTEKKWLMINQDHQAEMLASGAIKKYPTVSPTQTKRKSVDLTRSPTTMSVREPIPRKSTSSPGYFKSQKSDNLAESDVHFNAKAADQNSPEYYIQKFLDPNLRSVTPKIAESLEVSLRTRPIK
jgi:hypothetical protein